MAMIKAVSLVSDGILIVFDDGNVSYCATNTLYERRDELTCQTFLDYDPMSSECDEHGFERFADAGTRERKHDTLYICAPAEQRH